jgi:pilus assembly protein TadC
VGGGHGGHLESCESIVALDGLAFVMAVWCISASAAYVCLRIIPDIKLRLSGPLARYAPRELSARGREPRIPRALVIDELPHVMETLALACMSGLGLLQSIELLGTLEGSPLFSTFRHVSNDIATGVPRYEALDRLAVRLDSRVGTSLVSTLKQAELSGTPIVSVLISHAQAARREATIEKHRKIDLIPIKLVICTVVFLLPAVILAAIVPHIVAFTRTGW